MFSLLCGTALLLLGNGLLGTLLPIRGDLAGFSRPWLGLMGSAYFAGFVLGCWLAPSLLRRAGHIRVFAALASSAAALALLHALFPTPPAWVLMRGLTGACFAGLYAVIESWLNDASDNVSRGRVLAIYLILNLVALSLGQQMLRLAATEGYELFSLAAILVGLSLVPVAMTRQAGPPPVLDARLRPRWLWSISHAGTLGCVAVGLANGAFWAMAPVQARAVGLSVTDTAVFMSAAVLGGASLQWPLGRLSDRVDRRIVIAAVALVSALVGLGLVVTPPTFFAQVTLITAFGAFSFPLYTLSIAHVNDHVHRSDFVEASTGLLLLYGIGASVGPVVASAAMEALGPKGLFAWTAFVHAGTAAFVLAQLRTRPAVPAEDKEAFVEVPRTSPVVFELDPRGPESQVAAD